MSTHFVNSSPPPRTALGRHWDSASGWLRSAGPVALILLMVGALAMTPTEASGLTLDPLSCSPQGLTYDTPSLVSYVGWPVLESSVGGVNRGKSFVAWVQKGLEGALNDYTVFGAIADSAGTPILAIHAISDLTGNQWQPSVSTRANGNNTRIVTAWSGYNDLTGGFDVRARVYSYYDSQPDHIFGGGGFYVPRGSAGNQIKPQAQYLYDGTEMAFAWEDVDQNRIEYRLCDASGSCSLLDMVPHVTSAGSNFREPRLDAFAAGNRFIMVWASNRLTSGSDGTADYNIYYRRFDGAGAPVDATEVIVSPDNAYDERNPDVAVLEDGRFAITWWDQSTSYGDIWFRIYEYNGTPITGTQWVSVGHLPLVAGFDVGRRKLAIAFDRSYGTSWYRASQTFSLTGNSLSALLQGGQVPSFTQGPHSGLDATSCTSFVTTYVGPTQGTSTGVLLEYPSH